MPMTKSQLQALRARAADDNGACAELEAELWIDVSWYLGFVGVQDYGTKEIYEASAFYSDHNYDRKAARRAASCEVADKVIKGMSDD
jgi:hypothetical protein